MSEHRLRTFLNNAGNRRLVLCSAVIVSILCVSPFAIAYIEARNDRVHADAVATQLGQLKTAVLELTDELEEVGVRTAELRNKAISEDEIEGFRNQIMDLVRESDCRLRGLTVGDRSVRRWMEEDDALSDGDHFDSMDVEPVPTDYMIHAQNLDLIVTGSFENVRRLLESIQSLGRFVHTRSLDIHRESHADIRLQWSLGTFSLTHAPEEVEDDWDDAP